MLSQMVEKMPSGNFGSVVSAVPAAVAEPKRSMWSATVFAGSTKMQYSTRLVFAARISSDESAIETFVIGAQETAAESAFGTARTEGAAKTRNPLASPRSA